MKKYMVRECFNTLQGEGARAGARSVFLRLSGCNLWDGRPEHRAAGKGACARWCDTAFVGGEKLTAIQIIERLGALWPEPADGSKRWTVISGGEPALQVDLPLLDTLHAAGWMVAMETNGTLDPPGVLDEVDHLTVSPKLGGQLARWTGTELKVVLPGAVGGEHGWSEGALLDLAARGRWSYLYVQPQDPGNGEIGRSYLAGDLNGLAADYGANLTTCVEFAKAHPAWRLSLQTHKIAGLP